MKLMIAAMWLAAVLMVGGCQSQNRETIERHTAETITTTETTIVVE